MGLRRQGDFDTDLVLPAVCEIILANKASMFYALELQAFCIKIVLIVNNVVYLIWFRCRHGRSTWMLPRWKYRILKDQRSKVDTEYMIERALDVLKI